MDRLRKILLPEHSGRLDVVMADACWYADIAYFTWTPNPTRGQWKGEVVYVQFRNSNTERVGELQFVVPSDIHGMFESLQAFKDALVARLVEGGWEINPSSTYDGYARLTNPRLQTR